MTRRLLWVDAFAVAAALAASGEAPAPPLELTETLAVPPPRPWPTLQPGAFTVRLADRLVAPCSVRALLLPAEARVARSWSPFDEIADAVPHQAPSWIHGAFGVRPADLVPYVATSPRASLALLELDQRALGDSFLGVVWSEDPRVAEPVASLAASPDPEVRAAALLRARNLGEEEAVWLFDHGPSEPARRRGLAALCDEDVAWSDAQRAHLRDEARAARTSDMRVRASIELAKDAWSRQDDAALVEAMAHLDAARERCAAWGPLLDDADPRLRRTPGGMDALDPPLGPRGMAALARQLAAENPGWSVLEVDAGRYPVVAWLSAPHPGTTLLPSGVQVSRPPGGLELVGVGPGWTAMEAGALAFARLVGPGIACLGEDEHARLRAQMDLRLRWTPASALEALDVRIRECARGAVFPTPVSASFREGRWEAPAGAEALFTCVGPAPEPVEVWVERVE